MRAPCPGLLLVALVACSTPAEAPPPARSADYWLVLEGSWNVIGTRPMRTLRTVPVPVVRTLGIDISRVRPSVPARLWVIMPGGPDPEVAIEPGVDRYVLDVESGFAGFEPYQWGAIVISQPGSGDHRLWQTTVRAVPGWGGEQP